MFLKKQRFELICRASEATVEQLSNQNTTTLVDCNSEKYTSSEARGSKQLPS